MEVDYDRAIRLLAFHAVQERSPEYRLRSVMRWFSRTYSTPLAEVENMPTEYILSNYYEVLYAELESEELEKERTLLTESTAEKAERLRREAQDEASTEALLKQIEAEQKQDALKDKDLRALGDAKAQEMRQALDRTLPEPSLGNKQVLLPNISYKFVPNEEMEKLIAETDAANLNKGK
jgi:hypothetical protein